MKPDRVSTIKLTVTCSLFVTVGWGCSGTIYEGTQTFCSTDYTATALTYIKSVNNAMIVRINPISQLREDAQLESEGVQVINLCGENSLKVPGSWGQAAIVWNMYGHAYLFEILLGRLFRSGIVEGTEVCVKEQSEDDALTDCNIGARLYEDSERPNIIDKVEAVGITDSQFGITVFLESVDKTKYEFSADVELINTSMSLKYEPMTCSSECKGSYIPESVRHCEVSCDNGVRDSCDIDGEVIGGPNDDAIYCSLSSLDKCVVKEVVSDPVCVSSFNVPLQPTPTGGT